MYGCIVTKINIGKIESFLLLVTDLQTKLQTNLGSTFENLDFKYLNLILSNVDALSTFFRVLIGDVNARSFNWWLEDTNTRAGKELGIIIKN